MTWGKARHQIAAVLCVGLFAWAIVNDALLIRDGPGTDFFQFWPVARELGKAGADIYSESWRHQTGERYSRLGQSPNASEALKRTTVIAYLHSTATPVFYCCFEPICSRSYEHGLAIHKVLTFASGILGVLLLCQLLGFSLNRTLLVSAAVIGLVQAFWEDDYICNVSRIQLLMVSIAAVVELQSPPRWRDLLSGIWLGFIVLFKPSILMIPVLLVWMSLADRDYRRVVRLGGTLVVVVMIGVVLSSLRLHSSKCWFAWWHSLQGMEAMFNHPLMRSYSLRALVRTSLGRGAARAMVVTLLGLLLLVIGVTSRREQTESQRRLRVFIAIGVGAVAPLLVGVLAWSHYFVLCTPLLLLALRPIDAEELRGRFTERVGIGCICAVLLARPQILSPVIWLGGQVGTTRRFAAATLALLAWGLYELACLGKQPIERVRSSLSGDSAHASSNLR